jgi:hypothetical protein
MQRFHTENNTKDKPDSYREMQESSQTIQRFNHILIKPGWHAQYLCRKFEALSQSLL